jgi:nitrite reductase/ring-hydroxylating ferredoxin subunit
MPSAPAGSPSPAGSSLPATTPVPDEVVLGAVEDFAQPCLRLVHADGRRLLVARTSEGFHVTDNACPHEGYGLAQGDQSDGVLTCTWHNWKYRLADGHCLVGEEDLRMYPVTVRDGLVVASVRAPDPAAVRDRLTASVRRGLDDGYVGQLSRDIVRLLRADADPVQLVWEAVAWGAPRAEYGFGHAMASLVDCLTVAESSEGDARALPVVTAFAGIADTERRRPLRPQPDPVGELPARPGVAFRAAVEAEDLVGAEALLRGALALGAGPEEVRPWLVGAVTDHHLSYGHGAIYVQKAFALLDRLGWDRADTVLPHLVPAIGLATREDRLPYMRPYVRAVATLDLGGLARLGEGGDRTVASGPEGVALHHALLGRDASLIPAAVAGLLGAGAGTEGLLDAVVGVATHRLAHYDPRVEVASDRTDFGWLDVTHALTYAAAARWAWRSEPGPGTVRLALWAAFLAFYSGRRGYVEIGDTDDPVAAGAVPVEPAGLCRAALEDRAGSWIVTAHLIKTTSAAVAESAETGSAAPRAAAARFVAAPRREVFVALNVRKALQLADGRVPD